MGDMNFPDPNTTTEHYGWEWDSEKWVKWGSPLDPDSTKVVASGAMATGEMVVLNSDGTASVVSEIEATGATGVFQTERTDRPVCAYDPDTGKLVVFYGSEVKETKAVVATISGSTLSFGDPVLIHSTNMVKVAGCLYDPDSKNILLFSEGHVSAVSVSGDTLSVSPRAFIAVAGASQSVVYDPDQKRFLFAFLDDRNSYYGTALVGKMTGVGRDMEWSPETIFRSERAGEIGGMSYDPSNKKIVLAYSASAQPASSVYGQTATISGDAVTFGDQAELVTAPNYFTARFPHCAYDDVSGKTVVTFYNSYYASQPGSPTIKTGMAVAVSMSGTALTAGPVVDIYSASDTGYYNVWPLSVPSGGILAVYGNGDRGNSIRAKPLSVVGDTIQVGGELLISDTPSADFRPIYVEDLRGTVASYGVDGTFVGTLTYFSEGGTNLTQSNFMGVSKGDYTDGKEARVQFRGINSDQSGMTVGTQYIQNDGSLDTTEGTPSVSAGTAISATELNIKDSV